MLCPEIWNFDSPKHYLNYQEINEGHDVTSCIETHSFNHSVSVVLPNINSFPESFDTSITEDSDYYRVDGIHVVDLIDKEFIEKFIKKGELSLLSIGKDITVENVVAITPTGHLILSLLRNTYQKLGIEGKPTVFERKNHSRFGKMPKKHKVPLLQDLALKSISEFVTTFGKGIVDPITILSSIDPQKGQTYLCTLLMSMREQLSSSVPWDMHDQMAVETLKAIKNLINEIKKGYSERSTTFLTEINVAVNLTRVIVHPNLKRIEFSTWPKIMRHILYDSLVEMTGLEVLDLGSGSAGWQTSDIEKMIVTAMDSMHNLISFTLCFDCTDNIIAAICQNCPKLQKLDVTASRSVTDRSISFLLKCPQLREIKLLRTSVSIQGYSNLLLNSCCLEDIGRYDDLGIVLEYIQQNVDNFNKPFGLKTFECRNMRMQHLYLLIEMCPQITSLSMFKDEGIDDLAILASLTDLEELKLLSCNFYANGMQMLLEIIGCNIISLHLEHVGELDLSALIYISQFCPNLKSLVFYNCEFLAVTSTRHRKLIVPPFKYLEQLKCVVDCADTHLEFILQHCINVKFIHLGSSTGIGDAIMQRVFAKNRMSKLEELKILYSNDLSMATVHLLMQNCENLRRLSELESWDGISPQELDAFRKELKTRNIDLDTSPTLSLA